MTYCVGAIVDQGIVFLSDSRTNAGVDNVSTFRKMFVYERPGDRVLVLLTAGNLAITQAVVGLLDQALTEAAPARTLYTVQTLADAAFLVGEAIRRVYERDAAALKEHGVEFSASFILGGQIGREEPRLFQLYAPGNYIEAGRDTPYFQIGESKYGKPMIDRMVRVDTSLEHTIKCLLISMDSTMRSNLSVGLPLDLAVLRRDQLRLAQRMTLEADNEYLNTVHSSWSRALERAFESVPDPRWE